MTNSQYFVVKILPLMAGVSCIGLALMVLLPENLWDLVIGIPTAVFLIYCLVRVRRHQLGQKTRR